MPASELTVTLPPTWSIHAVGAALSGSQFTELQPAFLPCFKLDEQVCQFMAEAGEVSLTCGDRLLELHFALLKLRQLRFERFKLP